MSIFFIEACIIGAVAELEAAKEEQRRFNDLCKSLPSEKADELRAERKRRMNDELQHRRNMEVAREGRSLNFWGNR